MPRPVRCSLGDFAHFTKYDLSYGRTDALRGVFFGPDVPPGGGAEALGVGGRWPGGGAGLWLRRHGAARRRSHPRHMAVGGGAPPLRDNRRRPRPQNDLILVDDYLLGTLLVGIASDELTEVVQGHRVGTTNLFYARLCRSMAAERSTGRLFGDMPAEVRAVVAAMLEYLPWAIVIAPMRDLAWSMGQLANEHRGLSLLGAEAVAAAVHLDATLCVRDRNDGPGIRAAAEAMGVPYVTISS